MTETAGTVRFLNFRGKQYRTVLGADGLWRFDDGCIAGFNEDAASVDKIVRLGVGFFSVPEGLEVNVIAGPHDAKYTNPTWQRFHPRSEADNDLVKDTVAVLSSRIGRFGARELGEIFSGLAHGHGASYWEDPSTRGA